MDARTVASGSIECSVYGKSSSLYVQIVAANNPALMLRGKTNTQKILSNAEDLISPSRQRILARPLNGLQLLTTPRINSRPHWAAYLATQIRPMAVEGWLKS